MDWSVKEPMFFHQSFSRMLFVMGMVGFPFAFLSMDVYAFMVIAG